MNLSTNYLGLELKNPIMGVAPLLSKNLDVVKQLEDAGAGGIVMYSLFEEKIRSEQETVDEYFIRGLEGFAEASDFFPKHLQLTDLSGEEYLRYLEHAKSVVGIPIIANLAGTSKSGWARYAKEVESAGADAIELNEFYIPTDLTLSAQEVEQRYIDDLKAVREAVSVPVSIKVAPYFSSFGNMATKLVDAGADGLVLFNRFYAPDIDLETLERTPDIQLSSSVDMRIPLQWISLLSGQVKASLAAAGGIHNPKDVLKLLMVGADVTMLNSALIKNGMNQVGVILDGVKRWMEEHDYESVAQMKGSMSYQRVAESSSYEKPLYQKYMKMWQSM